MAAINKIADLKKTNLPPGIFRALNSFGIGKAQPLDATQLNLLRDGATATPAHWPQPDKKRDTASQGVEMSFRLKGVVRHGEHPSGIVR